MSKRFVIQHTAVAAIIALMATVLAASPVVCQVGDTVGGAASDDAAFAEQGEAVDIDVVANDDGMDEFDEAPTLLVVDQPDGGLLSTAFDEDGIAVLLFSANVTFSGITTGKYRACWGNSCDNAEVTVYVGGEACTIAGTNGPDTLTGTSGDDVICGLSGQDTIDGRGGDDLIFGGNGRDTLRGSGGADEIYGGRGDDTIIGGNGADRLFGRKGADIISGNGGADEIHGNRGRDTISGGNGNDMLFGGRGRDTITGGSGEDLIRGRRGDDDLRGNANADQIFGGRGDDSIRGNGGADVLDGGRGTDSVNGGNGEDTCTRGETVTNCEDEPVEPGVDTDGDGIPDDVDPDDDNDGTPDDQDAFPLDPAETTDTDGDGVGDNTDPDIDGDGVLNEDDAFPLDPTEDTDTDGDGTGNNADLDDDDDTFADVDDAFPLDPLEWLDTDGDGTGNNADLDDDDDGVPDVDDPDPLDPTVPDLTDTDGDGVPDSQDPDIDGDGIPNELDDFPTDANESSDTDGDGIGDNADPDADNDGVLNEDDAFPFDDGETVDSDGGGLGDNADPDDDDDGVFDDVDVFPNDGTEWEDTDGDGTGNNADTDDDNDGVPDAEDLFPTNGGESTDLDFDGIGDSVDTDLDGDGVPNDQDAFPEDSTVSVDSDGDGRGDRFDIDNDGDGTLDELDAFPEDPSEQLDTDEDGIGNNADTDDDGDGVLDAQDAFPLDGSETTDTDGDGLGDQAELTLDSDQDGEPDVSDPDRDGDTVPNELDEFPNDFFEQVDSDGDGVGDFLDDDDDDDGTPDELDLYPLDPALGEDSDGDGTIDLYDLDPASADETRFVVEASSDVASARIVSDNLISGAEVSISVETRGIESPLSAIAVSEPVDFSLLGVTGEFESARLTIPATPGLIEAPELWWFDESLGLWVPDGEDPFYDNVEGVFQATVRHFSTFVVLPGGSRPSIAEISSRQCAVTGVDVVFLVDQSGSTEYSYIIDGQLEPATDEIRPIVPGQNGTATRREEMTRLVLNRLNPGRDRVAVMGFGETADTVDLELSDGWATGSNAITQAVADLAETPKSGTDVVAAVQSAIDLLTGPEGSRRGRAIVILSNGGGAAVGDLSFIADSGVDVHSIAIGESVEADVVAITEAATGVHVGYPLSLDAFADLEVQLDRAIFDSGFDLDRDGLSDCQEENGVPTNDSLSFIGVGGLPTDKPDTWVTSEPNDYDTDGDFLWDSEEVVEIDLRSSSTLESAYSEVIAAGFDKIYRLRGDPRDMQDPIASDGSSTRGYLEEPPTGDLATQKVERLDFLTRPADVSTDLEEGTEIVALQLALGLRRVETVNDAIFALFGEIDFPVSPTLGDRPERLFALYRDLPVRSLNLDFDDDEIEILALIDEIDRSLVRADLDPGQRNGLLLDKSNYEFALIRGLNQNGNELRSDVALLEALTSRLVRPGVGGYGVELSTRGAFRTVKLLRTDPGRLDERQIQLREFLRYNSGSQQPEATADEYGMEVNDFVQLVLEYEAGASDLLRDWKVDFRPPDPFLPADQRAALEFLAASFFNEGLGELNAFEVTTIRDDTVCPAELRDDQAETLCASTLVKQKSILWTEFETYALEELAGGDRQDPKFVGLQELWDDVATIDASSGSWRLNFELEDNGEIDVSNRVDYIDDHLRYVLGRPLQLTGDHATWDYHENFPGLVTASDIQIASSSANIYDLFSTSAAQIDVAWSSWLRDNDNADGFVSRKDLEAFIEQNEGVIPDAVLEQMRLALEYGLFDDKFDFDDLKTVLELVGATLAVTAMLVGTGGAAGTILLLASVAAEGSAGVLYIVDGQFVEGAVAVGFLAFDAKLIGEAGLAAIRGVDRLGNVLPAGRLLSERMALRFDAVANVRSGSQSLPSGLRAAGRSDLSRAAALRADDVVTSTSSENAFLEFVTRDGLEETAKRDGATVLLPDDVAEEMVEATFASGRLDLDAAVSQRTTIFLDSDPRASQAFARWGDAAVDDPRLLDLVCSANSFAGDTLVVLGDGALVPIADVMVGDRVLAWDFDTGETVSRDVTATLPHQDWLLEAHLSDGTTLTVTEDHRFWSITDTAWVELQDLDPDDLLLTPDGAMVTVDYLDWDTGADAAAWDLTVAEEHNFFVAADHSAEPVLVHNADASFLKCVDGLSVTAAKGLADIGDGLADEVAQQLDDLVQGLPQASQSDLAEVIGRAGSDGVERANTVAANALVDEDFTKLVIRRTDFGEAALAGENFESTLAAGKDGLMGVADAVAKSTLSKNEAVDLATIMFNTDRGPRVARFLSARDAQRSSDFVEGFTRSRRAELSSEAELDTWHRATLNGSVDDSWDYAERARDGYRWNVPVDGSRGSWDRLPSGGLPDSLVNLAKNNIGPGPRLTVQPEVPVKAPDPVDKLGIGGIGDVGERALSKAKAAAGAEFVEQQRVTATLSIDGETTTYTFVPDLLVVDAQNPVVNNRLQLIFDDSKATITSTTPDLGNLSKNQTVSAWGIAQRDVPGSNVQISFSTNTPTEDLQALLDGNSVTEFDIVGVNVHPFRVVDP